MYYRIVITKFEDNPNYEAEYQKHVAGRKFRGYNAMDTNDETEPARYLQKQALYSIASEEQFAAIRKAALEQF